MNFTQILQNWLKGELSQAKIMIAIGVLALIVLIAIFRSQHELLRGAMIPIGLIVLVLLGYGGSILSSRPVHVKQSLELYENNPTEATSKEIEKHSNDNKSGNMLIKYIYPSIMIISVITLYLVGSAFYKGLALGCILMAMTAYTIDYGFVTRSNTVIEQLQK